MSAPSRMSDSELFTPFVKPADLKDVPFVIVGYGERENEYKGKVTTQSVFIIIPVAGNDRGHEFQLTVQKNHSRAKLGAKVKEQSRGPFFIVKVETDKNGKKLDPAYWAFKDAGEENHKKAVALFEWMQNNGDDMVPEEDDLPF